MKYCDKCKITTDYDSNLCPLCQNIISDTEMQEESIFPLVPNIYKENKLFFKILVLVCVLSSALVIFLDILIKPKVHFSIFVICGIICLLIILKIGINKKHNISKNTLIQIIVISLLSYIWDYFTGYKKWSITFVIPILSLVGSINIILLVKIFKLYIEDYLIYVLIITFLGLIPIIFLVLNLVITDIPSLICIFINGLLLVLFIIFKRNEVFDELKRRLHI